MQENELKNIVIKKINALEKPKRLSLSFRYPRLKKPIILTHRLVKKLRNFFTIGLTKKRKNIFLPSILVRHQSLLMKKLGESDPRLQKQKITNLKIVAEKINGLTLKPGQSFSLWHTVGKPSKRRGFVNGMLLSNGAVVEGLGGGMCQMSNLLYWMFLHSDLTVTERYHHSLDVFPDSGRILPFGSGATIFYNYIDLKVKNTTKETMQIKVWVTDKHLKGQLLSNKPAETKYHVFEKNHYFIKNKNKYYRFNEIWKEKKSNGDTIGEEKIATNFAPVLYPVNESYLKQNNYPLLEV